MKNPDTGGDSGRAGREGQDAQLLEPLGSLGADALEIAYRGVRREGGVKFGRHGAASFQGK